MLLQLNHADDLLKHSEQLGLSLQEIEDITDNKYSIELKLEDLNNYIDQLEMS